MTKKHKIIIGGIAITALMLTSYSYLDSILFDGVQPQSINAEGFRATLFSKDDIENRPAIVLIGGGEWGHYWGQEFAKANYVGLSVPYYRQEGLPELLQEIPLEYFEKAISWLSKQAEVNSNKIIVMGASRNAELALLIASHYPEIVHGAIAYSPSSVSWSNTVLPFNSDAVKPSFTFENKPVPFIPMAKLKGGESDTIETLPYWTEALLDSHAVHEASIQVENIGGPILLLSGLEDEVWPSAMMGDMIEQRLKESHFNFDFENIQYENAGHLISGNPHISPSIRSGTMMIDGHDYHFYFGGTEEGDRAAQQSASASVFHFLSKFENE